MYYEHFGLKEPPFKITPDTRLFYTGGNRGPILDAIVYAVTSGEGIIKVVGEVGSGKTMLCRMLEVRLPQSVEVVYLANPSLSPENILHAIAFEMRLPLEADANRLRVMQALQDYLLEKHANDRQVVVFVEEAQSMPLETLEEIRLLSNLETQRAKLLQIILFGQPELEPNLSEPHIRQLRERITHSFDLPPLGRQETKEYLDFRMRAAGYRGPSVFSAAAIRVIARTANGLIRRTNILADKSLLAAYAGETHTITGRHAKVAVKDSEFGRPGKKPLAGFAFAAGVALLILAVGWYLATGGYLSRMVSTIAGEHVYPPTAYTGAPAVKEEHAMPSPPPQVAGEEQIAEVRIVDLAGVVTRPAEIEKHVTVVSKLEPKEETQSWTSGTVKAPQEGSATETLPPVERKHVDTSGSVVTGRAMESEAVLLKNIKGDGADNMAALGLADGGKEKNLETVTSSGDVIAKKMLAEKTDTHGNREPGTLPAPEVETKNETAGEARDFRKELGKPLQGESKDRSFLERRLAETTKWLGNADGSHYSIQLMLVSARRAAGLEENLRHGGLDAELENVYVYKTRIRGMNLISILLGEYAAYNEARRRLEGLTPALRRARPFIRNISDIQAIKRRMVTGG